MVEHGGAHNLVRSFRPSASQLFISLLIAGLGWLSGQALSRVDQDLRIMYVEYTLGAADLVHISADDMRYSHTIIRAFEAHSQKDFERIAESLLTQRARIQHAVDRYEAAGLPVPRSGLSEPEDIEAFRRNLGQYFSVASTTVQLLTLDMDSRLPDRTGSDQAEGGRARRRQRRPENDSGPSGAGSTTIRLRKNYLGTRNFDSSPVWLNRNTRSQGAQKVCPARPQRAKKRGIRFGTLSL